MTILILVLFVVFSAIFFKVSAGLTAMFYGRSHIPGLICGARVRFNGSVGLRGGQPVMINPAYELLSLNGE